MPISREILLRNQQCKVYNLYIIRINVKVRHLPREVMRMNYIQVIFTPIGALTLKANENELTEVCFGARETKENRNSVTELAAKQIEEYFDGKRKSFDVPHKLCGTEFQIKVWEQLKSIPYGETAAYSDIAEAIGNRSASRAVGMANNKNKLPIIIPCHRVIGKNGSLVGYAGGLDIKEKLLKLEKEHTDKI